MEKLAWNIPKKMLEVRVCVNMEKNTMCEKWLVKFTLKRVYIHISLKSALGKALRESITTCP